MEEFLPQALTVWITQYGSFALFVLLAVGIFALPIPDETLMVFAGFLVAHGKLEPIPTLIAACAGACSGITVSYVLGRTAGTYLLKKYGHWIRITEAKMQRVHDWFERIGRFALLIGYFIPGVRHLTGYAAGISELEYSKFALFSYSGACIWVVCFLSLGYFLGNRWVTIIDHLDQRWYQLILIALGIVLLLGIYFWLRMKKRKHDKLNAKIE
ncbi:MAG TPA: DedA family protein [Gammaproteobacteria bacterium]|nr:DedA family protein [Gammaproteobacteria bacterium]